MQLIGSYQVIIGERRIEADNPKVGFAHTTLIYLRAIKTTDPSPPWKPVRYGIGVIDERCVENRHNTVLLWSSDAERLQDPTSVKNDKDCGLEHKFIVWDIAP